MSPRSRSRFRGGFQGPRRGVEWKSAATSTITSLGSGLHSSQFIVLPSIVRTYTNPTLVRTRGQLSVMKSAINNPLIGAAGLIAWADRDDTAPLLGECPQPFQDPDLDWIWHTYLFGSSAEIHDLKWSEGFGTSIDSKAMRKLGSDDGILFVIQNHTGTATFSWAAGFRCLIKE